MSIGEGSGSGAGTEFVTNARPRLPLDPAVHRLPGEPRRPIDGRRPPIRRQSSRIVALTISDSTECALVRFLLSDPEQGREILERAGLALVESDLIGVELPDSQQPMLQICTALSSGRSKHHADLSAAPPPHRPARRGLMVDNIEMAIETLRIKGFHAINEDELKETGV